MCSVFGVASGSCALDGATCLVSPQDAGSCLIHLLRPAILTLVYATIEGTAALYISDADGASYAFKAGTNTSVALVGTDPTRGRGPVRVLACPSQGTPPLSPKQMRFPPAAPSLRGARRWAKKEELHALGSPHPGNPRRYVFTTNIDGAWNKLTLRAPPVLRIYDTALWALTHTGL